MEHSNNKKDLEACLTEVQDNLEEIKSIPKKKRFNKHKLAFELLTEEMGFIRELIADIQKKSSH